MSKKFKGAFWPDLKKIGCAKIQREMNCDPTIARWFATHLVVMKAPHAPVYLFEASEDQWKDIAKTWEAETEAPLPKLPIDPRLH